MSICWKCKGSGRILEKVENPTIPGSMDYYPKTCPDCQGTGYLDKKNNKNSVIKTKINYQRSS